MVYIVFFEVLRSGYKVYRVYRIPQRRATVNDLQIFAFCSSILRSYRTLRESFKEPWKGTCLKRCCFCTSSGQGSCEPGDLVSSCWTEFWVPLTQLGSHIGHLEVYALPTYQVPRPSKQLCYDFQTYFTLSPKPYTPMTAKEASLEQGFGPCSTNL